MFNRKLIKLLNFEIICCHIFVSITKSMHIMKEKGEPAVYSCPASYLPYNQSCYKYVKIKVGKDAAMESCANESGQLASIKSVEEYRFINTSLLTDGSCLWNNISKLISVATKCGSNSSKRNGYICVKNASRPLSRMATGSSRSGPGCPPGMVLNESNVCVKCSAGLNIDTNGTVRCREPGYGQVAVDGGTVFVCDIGYGFTPAGICAPCAEGSYKDIRGDISCHPCPGSSAGATKCDESGISNVAIIVLIVTGYLLCLSVITFFLARFWWQSRSANKDDYSWQSSSVSDSSTYNDSDKGGNLSTAPVEKEEN